MSGHPVKATVGPDHSVLKPVHLSIPHRLPKTLANAFTVIGMNGSFQVFECERVIRRQAKVRLACGGTNQFISAEVQVYSSHFGGAQSYLQQLFALAQFLFCALAVGDIYVNADQTQRPARVVEEDLPTRLEPVDAAVRPDHPIFGAVLTSVYERAPHGLFGARPVFGMHKFRPGFVAAAESAGRQSV